MSFFLAVFSVFFWHRGGNDIEDDDDANMDIDGTKKIDEVSLALAAANAVGNTTNISISGTSSQDMIDGLRELNMDHYDDEDDGNFLSVF